MTSRVEACLERNLPDVIGRAEMGQIEIDHAWDEMLYYLGDVVNGVQDGAEIRGRSYEKYEHWAHELTRQLRNSEFLPRERLHRLRKMIGMLEGSVEHFDGQGRVLEMIDSIQFTFNLLVSGQCHDDYSSGAPHIG